LLRQRVSHGAHVQHRCRRASPTKNPTKNCLDVCDLDFAC
jgi:hypothetical protein